MGSTEHFLHLKTPMPFAVSPTSGSRLSLLPDSKFHLVSRVWFSAFSVTRMLCASAVCLSCMGTLWRQLTIQYADRMVFPCSVLPGAVGLLFRPFQRDSCPFSQAKGAQVVWLCSHSAISKGSLHVPTALDLCALALSYGPTLTPSCWSCFLHSSPSGSLGTLA